MGYETRLIVGKSRTLLSQDKAAWFEKMAVIDLCVLPSPSDILQLDWKNKNKEPLVCWYLDDGNTQVTEDSYGDMPKPLPIEQVSYAVMKDMASSEYRRLKWALGLLEAMEDDPEGLEVLITGH